MTLRGSTLTINGPSSSARTFSPASDPRVEIIDKQVEKHPGLSITNFYVGYLLPMMIEVQHFAFGGSPSGSENVH